jgi:hypothetical protein
MQHARRLFRCPDIAPGMRRAYARLPPGGSMCAFSSTLLVASQTKLLHYRQSVTLHEKEAAAP